MDVLSVDNLCFNPPIIEFGRMFELIPGPFHWQPPSGTRRPDDFFPAMAELRAQYGGVLVEAVEM